MEPEDADFSGFATKAGIKCTDGRTIQSNAFQHQDGLRVPLVWHHGHSDPENVLGHALLKNQADGVYAYCFFNDSPKAQHTKLAVQHGDLDALSIWANQLVEKAKTVLHGMIREVSLVLAGANSGAKIDYVKIQHGDGPDDYTELDDVAIIHTGLPLENIKSSQKEPTATEEVVEHADGEKTIRDVFETMTDEQKAVVYYMVDAAADTPAAEHSGTNDEDNLEHQEGTNVTKTRNVFEQAAQEGGANNEKRYELTHADMVGILKDAESRGSLKAAVLDFGAQHGIDNIDYLFPDAKTLRDRPEFNKRRTEWVQSVISGVSHTPFSRIKMLVADLTQDAARAKGYIKGTYKKEEWFRLTKRTTTPTTIYKKQKLDRDDIIDVTDFDTVAWLKMEMRMMLDEEIAIAILIGDSREPDDPDKIKDPGAAQDGAGIRAIANENELYATTINVEAPGEAGGATWLELIEAIIRSKTHYKGSGGPTLYSSEEYITNMLLERDGDGRRFFRTEEELASELRVSRIVAVEAMEREPDIIGIIVNLSDYNVGTDKGGEVNWFDDFDIDYNQYKYLAETRMSGSLTRIKSAIIIRKVDADDTSVVPTVPTFVASTGVVTIPTKTGVVYKDSAGTTVSAGAKTAIAAGATVEYYAVPATDYYFPTNANTRWTFTRDHA